MRHFGPVGWCQVEGNRGRGVMRGKTGRASMHQTGDDMTQRSATSHGLLDGLVRHVVTYPASPYALRSAILMAGLYVRHAGVETKRGG